MNVRDTRNSGGWGGKTVYSLVNPISDEEEMVGRNLRSENDAIVILDVH